MIKVSDILNIGLTDMHSQSFGDHWALEKKFKLMKKVHIFFPHKSRKEKVNTKS